jgi:nitronate monooxygenase
VLALGAQAAQLGTAFLACVESGATDAHRAVLRGERSERTVLTRAYTGRLARGVPNRLTEEIGKYLGRLPPFPAHAWFVARLKGAAAEAGHPDLLPLYAGQATPNLRHRRAADLMAALIED